MGDCLDKLSTISDGSVDGFITSPPYNTGIERSGRSDKYNKRYSSYKDARTNPEYIQWQVSVLNEMERVLAADGCILYNINYGGENNETMWLLLAEILKNTNLTIADQIIWKKRTAIPNNRSKNKLTRICENIFVLCRKSEYLTFNTNKAVISVIEKTGQKNFENLRNLVEARNNDGRESSSLHKATYSTELCEILISMYFKKGSHIADPFMGLGTTGIACVKKGLKFTGIEIDEDYFNTAVERINNTKHEEE